MIIAYGSRIPPPPLSLLCATILNPILLLPDFLPFLLYLQSYPPYRRAWANTSRALGRVVVQYYDP